MMRNEDAIKYDDRHSTYVIDTSLQPDPGTVGVCLTYRVTGHIKEY